MSAIARFLVGRAVNKTGASALERELQDSDDQFWSDLRETVAQMEAADAVIRANMEAEEVSRETRRKLARGEL